MLNSEERGGGRSKPMSNEAVNNGVKCDNPPPPVKKRGISDYVLQETLNVYM